MLLTPGPRRQRQVELLSLRPAWCRVISRTTRATQTLFGGWGQVPVLAADRCGFCSQASSCSSPVCLAREMTETLSRSQKSCQCLYSKTVLWTSSCHLMLPHTTTSLKHDVEVCAVWSSGMYTIGGLCYDHRATYTPSPASCLGL